MGLENIRIKNDGTRVKFIRDNVCLLNLHWKEAESARCSLRRWIRSPKDGVIYASPYVKLWASEIPENGLMGLAIGSNTQLMWLLPPAGFYNILNMLTSNCRLAEANDIAVINSTIEEQAMLQRSGALPVGLTGNVKIQREAMKEAHWGKKHRKYMVGGVKNNVPMGVPSLVHTTPSDRIRKIITGGTDHEKAELRKRILHG